MKTFQKVLCVILSVLMAMSCLSAVAFAAEGEKFTTTVKAHTNISNANSAKLTLDMIDEALAQAEKDMNKEGGSLKFDIDEIGKSVDFRSINDICDTLDDFNNILRLLKLDFTGVLIGDLNSLDVSTWKKGMSRTGDDINILKEFIELAAANRELVAGICDASIDLGVFKNYIKVETLLGADGISGVVKEALIGFIYEKGSAEFTTAYNTYKNDMDAFIYDVLIPYFTKDMLPGLDINADTTLNDLLIDIYNISFDKYIKDAVSSLDISFTDSEYAEFKKLEGIINLKGSSYDLSGLKYEKSDVSIQDQVNRILGNYMKNFVPGYTSWNFNGGYSALKSNIEGSIRYVAEKSGIVANSQSKTIEQIGVEIALIILCNGNFGPYAEGIESCKTLEEIASKFLINASKEMKLGINYTGNESYLVVLGDMLAAAAYDSIPLADEKGNTYRAGGGKDFFEVANYILNFFLIDRSGAAVLGLDTSKSEDFYTKLDKLADYFGQNGSVSFNSKNFIHGTSGKKGVLDCLFSLDIVGLLDLTAIPVLKIADVHVIEFLYKTVQYFTNNWADSTFFPTYQTKAFTNALSNGSIANMISSLLETLENRKSAVVSVITYIAALAIKGGETTDYSIESATVSDIVATGKTLFPTAAVKAGGKNLVQGTDYVVVTKSLEPGKGTATIKGIGLYSGEITRSFNIKLANVSTLTYTAATNAVTLKWNSVPYADSYNITKYNPTTKKYDTVKTGVTGTSYTVSGLASGSEYKLRVQAVDTAAGGSTAKEVTAYTLPSAVITSGVKSTPAATSIKLTWTAVTGATHYRIEQSAGSNKWTKLTETTALNYTVTGLTGGTEYTYRITALKKLPNGSFIAASPITVKAKTALAAPTVKATAATKSVTLSWAKVKNAQKYLVEQYKNNAWVTLGTVTATSYTVSKLSSATEYKFRVTAQSSAYAASSKTNVTVTTLPEAVKSSGIKTSVTASSVKLSWSKVTGATHYKVEQYVSKKWKEVAIVSGTSTTVSGLTGYTSYSFRITALKKLSNGSYAASSPVTVKAKTKLGTTTSLKATYTDTTITLTWAKVKNAQKYEVLRYTGGKWKKVKTVTGTSCKVTGLKATTSYKLAVRAVVTENKTNIYGAQKQITQYTGLKQTTKVKASSVTASSAKISWSKVSGAASYEVYAYVGGEWVKKGTSKTTSLTIKGLPSGQKTKIKVRAVAKLGGKSTYGVYSSVLSVLTTVGKVTNLKASVRKTDSITLTWKKTTGATSYEIYRLIDGKWKKLGTTTKTTFTDSKSLKRSTEYKYKVRAVQKIDKKTTRYGAYSAQLKAKTTLIGTAR